MSKKNIVAIITIVAVAGIIGILPSSFAQSVTFENEEPVKYKVGIDLTNIGKIDRESGSYELIFWVTIVSDDLDLTKFPPPDEWDFTNGYIQEVTGVSTEPNFHKFKVRGVFYNEIDFSRYPFEKMELDVHMEPFYPLTVDKLVFEANHEYIGSTLDETVTIPGWELEEIDVDTYIQSYPWGDFTHLEVTFPAHVNPISAFIKKILPVAILVGVSYSSFWLPYTRTSERISFTVGALIAAMLFHRFLLNEIPPIGYLTLADVIMITAYTLFTLTLITVIIHTRRQIQGGYTDEQAKKLDHKMKIITIIISAGIFISLRIYQF